MVTIKNLSHDLQTIIDSNSPELWVRELDKKPAKMAELLVGILKQCKWKKDPELYNICGRLFCKVVRDRLDKNIKKDLKGQIKEIKKLFKQFEVKKMPDAYQSEKSDKDHHNGTDLKKLAKKGKVVVKGERLEIDEKDLKKIPEVQYAGRSLRVKTWVNFRNDGTIRKAGFGHSKKNQITKIFVMDKYGQFHISKDIQGDAKAGKKAIKHSTFFNGKPVAAAGKMICNNDGKIVKVTNSSGHYEPGKFEMRQVAKSLMHHGANVDDITFEIQKGDKKKTYKGKDLV